MAKTILLADDSVTIQKVVELTFMDEDYRVVAASDGGTALSQLAETAPDLVIADVHMPGADGYEVCRSVKESFPHIPVLLLVGTFEQFDEAKAQEVRADGHLKKPFDSQDLLSLVERLTSHEAAGAAEAAPAAAEAETADLEPPMLMDEEPSVGEDTRPTEARSVDEAPAFETPAVEAPAAAPAETFAPLETPFPVAEEPETVSADAFAETDELEVPELEAPPVELVDPAEEFQAAPAPEAADVAPEPAPEPGPATPEPALPSSAFETSGGGFKSPFAESEPEAAPEPEELAPPSIEDAGFELEPEPAPEPVTEVVETAPEPAVEAAPEPVVEAAPEPVVEAAPEPAPAPAAPEPAPAPAAPEPAAPAAAASANGSGSLSDEDVERIAQRVAELVGDKAVREVAWEVVPDLAEVIIKERIRELESQVE